MALNARNPHPHSLRVQIGTFNYNLRGSSDYETPDLQPWLVPTVEEDEDSGYATAYSQAASGGHREAPDIYAVGFQEILPLNVGFSGSGEGTLITTGAAEVLNDTDREIRKAIRPHQAIVNKDGLYPPNGGPEGYTLIGRSHLVGLALFVYARERNDVVARVKEVRTNHVGTGFFNMLGNKGAVGVRVVLEGGQAQHGAGEEPDQVLTFVCAHLAAHDHNVPRRNRDWKNIVSRLVFPPDSVEPLPSLQVAAPSSRGGPANLDKLKDEYSKKRDSRPGKALDNKEHSIYNTSHLFVLGDLNYRIAVGVPPLSSEKSLARGPLMKKDVGFKVAMEEWELLSTYDQLSIERQAGKVFHGLTESPLGGIKFGPTYKYKVDKKNKQHKKKGGSAPPKKKKSAIADVGVITKKRIPGWTDRILWRSFADGKNELRGQNPGAVDVELYRSIMTYTVSRTKERSMLRN